MYEAQCINCNTECIIDGDDDHDDDLDNHEDDHDDHDDYDHNYDHDGAKMPLFSCLLPPLS